MISSLKKFLRKLKKHLRELLPRTNRQRFILAVAVVFLLLFAAPVLYRMLKSGNSTPEQQVITYSTDNPDESFDNAQTFTWSGGPEDPRRIIIDKIQANGYIQKMGVDQHNKIAAPTNVHLAGWFIESAKPGEPGLSIIAAHVSGRSVDGLFKQLASLEINDEFQVERGDGTILRYQVIGLTTVSEAESASVLYSQDPKMSSQLNLITCSGPFDRSQNSYEQRTIVQASLIQ